MKLLSVLIILLFFVPVASSTDLKSDNFNDNNFNSTPVWETVFQWSEQKQIPTQSDGQLSYGSTYNTGAYNLNLYTGLDNYVEGVIYTMSIDRKAKTGDSNTNFIISGYNFLGGNTYTEIDAFGSTTIPGSSFMTVYGSNASYNQSTGNSFLYDISDYHNYKLVIDTGTDMFYYYVDDNLILTKYDTNYINLSWITIEGYNLYYDNFLFYDNIEEESISPCINVIVPDCDYFDFSCYYQSIEIMYYSILCQTYYPFVDMIEGFFDEVFSLLSWIQDTVTSMTSMLGYIGEFLGGSLYLLLDNEWVVLMGICVSLVIVFRIKEFIW